MEKLSPKRQLAAIMFTDIVGYTALMGKDSDKALELIRVSKEIQKPLVEKYNGKWLKEMGDGAMAQFSTALDAVNCSIEIQEVARAKLDGKLRIGIHSGDITIEDDDVYGDGVNVASRLESIADPGGIYISDAIQKAIRGQTDIQEKYLGEVRLKNVDYGVRTYAVQGVGLPVPDIKEKKELSGHFWAEIQRRGVLRVGMTYIIFSLLVFLLTREAISWIDLTTGILTVITTILLIGFPVAIYLAWNYERSPEGFVRTTSQQSWQNPYKAGQRKPLTGNFIIAGMALIIVVMYMYPRYVANPVENAVTVAEVKIDAKSIAVLPFVNMSNDPDQEYFSDGLSMELLNALVRIPGLKVIGRTSSWTYKGVTNKDVKVIGEELGVGAILEGSVTKAGTNIRIVAQLTNTEDGFNLWSHTYDRELTDIFAVQDEITAAIVDALKVHLTNETISIKPTTTADIDAYTIYLQARQRLASRGIENLIEARRLFEEAIRLDPDYDPAYSGLGRAISLFPYYSTEFSAHEVAGPAKDAANKALELNPQNSEAFSVLGMVATYFEWDWKAAEEAFNKSLELSHDDAEIYNFIGDYYRVVGHPTLAIEMESRALELDPLHAVNHSDLAFAYALVGDWENALRYAKSAQALGFLHTANNDLLFTQSYIELGRLDEAENVVAGLDDNNNNYYVNLYIKTIMAIAKGDSVKAISYIELLVNEAENLKVSSRMGTLYLDLGMHEEAAYWFEKAYENRELELMLPLGPGGLTLPENLPDHPALQAALDKPELNALFEIRRKNLGLTNDSP
ncbi:MAG: hypothetical protein IIB82_15060 [Bacteroidetes bacterium]|nr:hypothetical protein [Bacteroidota bacterium]